MEFRTQLGHHLYQNRYFYLLMATLLQVFLSSFFPDRGNLFINEMTLSLFLLANLNFVRHDRKFVMILLVFVIIIITMIWIPSASDLGQHLYTFEHLLIVLFITTIIYLIIIHIIRSKVVSLNLILGVITIYILFGMIAGECNLIIYYFDHEAFSGNLDAANDADLRYFSYVTMTTLGYGDIAPVSKIARATSVFFSLIGQIYLAVVIALIVGKYVSHSDKKELKNLDK